MIKNTRIDDLVDNVKTIKEAAKLANYVDHNVERSYLATRWIYSKTNDNLKF